MMMIGSSSYAAIALMVVLTGGLVVAMLVASWLFGPGRKGPEKSIPFESGVDPIGTTRWPFHARFYLLAILFLLFDVELIFFYPWAVLFHGSVSEDLLIEIGVSSLGLLIEIGVFSVILAVALLYAWARGVFDWR